MYLVGLEEAANFTLCVCVCMSVYMFAWVCIYVCVCLHKCPLIIHARGRHYWQPPFRDGAWDSEKWRTFQRTDSVRLLSLVPVMPRTSRACLIQQWNWAVLGPSSEKALCPFGSCFLSQCWRLNTSEPRVGLSKLQVKCEKGTLSLLIGACGWSPRVPGLK